MIIIGICDGDTNVRATLSEFVSRYHDETELNIQVLSYDSGEKLLQHYPFEMDLIFLEIPFRKMNGIEIARRVRQTDPKVGVVFLTTVRNRVLEAYSVRADDYILKPLRYARFVEEVERVRAKSSENRFFIEAGTNGIYKIYTKSIRYIETDGRHTRIYTEQETILSTKRMKDFEQLFFEPYFVRCHTGFIVNLLYFNHLNQNELYLNPNICIPVSRGKRTLLLEGIHKLYERGKE